MAHPLIGFRGESGKREPIVLGTGLSVQELIKVVAAQGGNVDAAAALLGLDARLIQAAVAYSDEHETAAEPDTSDGGKGVVAVLGQTAAVIALVTAIVYLAGAFVLGLRLAFAHVPWEAVLGQLPRELLITTGAREAMLPALLVALGYATFRLLSGGGRPRLARSAGRTQTNARRWR